MRTGTIQIGGKAYQVAGLSVSANLAIDFDYGDASKKNDNAEMARLQVKRIALCLQRAQEWLPDPKNPNGSLQSSELTTERVVEIIDDLFEGTFEFLDAQTEVMKLNGTIRNKAVVNSLDEVKEGEKGESPATGS